MQCKKMKATAPARAQEPQKADGLRAHGRAQQSTMQDGVPAPAFRFKMPRNLPAVYTVEAAWIFALCLFTIYATIALSFTLYHGTVDYIGAHTPPELHAAKTFRLLQAGKEIAGWD